MSWKTELLAELRDLKLRFPMPESEERAGLRILASQLQEIRTQLEALKKADIDIRSDTLEQIDKQAKSFDESIENLAGRTGTTLNLLCAGQDELSRLHTDIPTILAGVQGHANKIRDLESRMDAFALTVSEIVTEGTARIIVQGAPE